MRERLRKVGKIGLWALAIVFGLLVLIVLLLQTPVVKDWVRGEIVSRTNRAIEGELKVDELSGNLVRGVTARGVTLRDQRGRPIAHVDRLSATFEIWSLIGAGLDVDQVTVEDPRVLVRRYPDGTINVETLTAPEEKPAAPAGQPSNFPISVDEYTLEGGTVIWQDLQMLAEKSTLDKDEIQQVAQLADRVIVPPEGTEPTTALERFAAALERFRRERTDPPAMALADELTLQGSVDLTTRPRVENRLASVTFRLRSDTLPEAHRASLSDVKTLFRPGRLETQLGRLDLSPSLVVTGSDFYADLAADDAGGEPADGETDQDGLQQFVGNLGEAHISREMLDPFVEGRTIESDVVLEATIGGSPEHLYARPTLRFDGAGTIRLGGTLDLRPAAPTYRASLLGTDLQLGEIVDGDLPDARLNIAAHLDGKAFDPENLSAETRLTVWNSSIDDVAIDAIAASASAADETFRLQSLAFKTPQLTGVARGRFQLDGTFDLHAETRSSDGELTPGDLGLEKGAEVRLDRADFDLDATGKLDLEAQSPLGHLQRADVDTSWNVQNARLGEFRLDSSTADLTVDAFDRDGLRAVEAGGELSVDQFRWETLALQRGRLDFEASGEIDEEADSPTDALTRFRSTLSGRVLGFQKSAMRIRGATVDGTIASASGPRAYTSDLEVDVSAADLQGFQFADASTEVETQVVLSRDLSEPIPLARLSTRGEFTMTTISAPSFSAERASANFQFEGPPTDPVGRLSLQVGTSAIAGREFTGMHLDVDTESGRTLHAELRARPAFEPDQPYLLETTVGYGAEFSRFELRSLELGRPTRTWQLAEPSIVELLRNGVAIDTFRLINERQSIAIDGIYRTTGRQSLSLTVDRFDIGAAQALADYHPVANLDGLVDLSVELGGTHRAPQVDMSLELGELTALGYGPFSSTLQLETSGRRVDIQQFTASAADHVVTRLAGSLPLAWDLSGDWDFRLESPTSLELTVEPTRLAEIEPVFPSRQFQAVGGEVAGSFDFGGSLADPTLDMRLALEDLSIVGELNGVDVDLEDVESTTTFRYGKREAGQRRISLDSEVVWEEQRAFGLEVQTDAPLIDWGVAYARENLSQRELVDRLIRAPVHASLALEETEVGRIPLEVVREADGQGTVSATLNLDGTLLQPDAQTTLDVDDFGWNQYRDIFVDLQASLQERMLRLEQFRVEWDADEILLAEGKVPVPAKALADGRELQNLPIDFTLQIKPIPVAKLSAIDYSFTQIQGTISGYLRMNGTLRSPEVDARLSVVDALFSEQHRGTVAAWLWTEDGRVKGGTMACRDTQPILTGQYDLPMNTDIVALAAGASPFADGQLDASLEGQDVPVAQLIPMPLLDEWIAAPEGYLQVDMGLEGTWDQPDPHGTFGVDQGAVTIIQFGRRFENIDLATQLQEDSFELEKLHVEDAEGYVNAVGEAQLDGLLPRNFAMKTVSEDFNIAGIATEFPAVVTSRTSIEGEMTQQQLTADIDVTDLNVEITDTEQQGLHPTELSSDIVVTEAESVAEATEISEYLTQGGAAAGLSTIQFDVDVDRNSFVRHPNGFVNFSADLSGQLTGGQTALNGAVETIRGEVEFLGRQFQIPNREAVVQFTGATPPNPRLDAQANYPLPSNVVAELEPPLPEDPAIYVRVTGTANEPNLQMSSDPTMSETDIIFVLMTGRAPTTADVGESQGVASQAAAAAGGVFAGLLQQRLSTVIPVDVLRLETGEEGLAGSQLRVGKYITPDLFISYAQSLSAGEESAYEARVEYHFLPSWMLEAEYGENQTGAINIFWDLY